MTRFLLALLATAAPAAAQDAAPLPPPSVAAPAPPSWPGVFAALRARDWATAQRMAEQLPDGPLKPVARAEALLGSGAPGTDAATLAALVAEAPALPEAPALAALARARGVAIATPLPAEQPLMRGPQPSRRLAARAGRADAAVARLAAQVQPLIKANDPVSAEPLVEAAAIELAPEALAEWRQRVAWTYFQRGDDAGARRVAALAQAGVGEWATQGAWVNGLAAWRAGDWPAASAAFALVAQRGEDGETRAAGLYWQARAETAGGRPQLVQPLLRAAAARGETFYGLLAAAALGAAPPSAPPAPDADLAQRLPNLRTAEALAALGEFALADSLVRRQARIGAAADHPRLIAFAGRIGLPQTQLWLARNCPAGAQSALAARYPMPAWAPSGGWRVDRALVYAHALQESQFRTDAVSRAGARGLMQLMPGTARLVARHRGDPADAEFRLTDPALNFEYGQSYLEELAGHAGTGGLLPKVIAAYNAGPNNVALWNLQAQVQADPLLFIEAIPFGETRAYVAIVLRNYWMYQQEAGAPAPSLHMLAQERWPAFPGTAAARTAARTGGIPAGN